MVESVLFSLFTFLVAPRSLRITLTTNFVFLSKKSTSSSLSVCVSTGRMEPCTCAFGIWIRTAIG